METAIDVRSRHARRTDERPLAVFASSADDERRRRPVDVFTLVVAGLLVLGGGLDAHQPTEFGTSLTTTLTALPGWIDTMLGGVFALAAVYVVGVVILTIGARDRLGLLRDLLVAVMPVPGGIGVSEFALTACLVAVGVPQAQALSAVIVHRMITYYLPPLWGYFALRWMRHHEYL